MHTSIPRPKTLRVKREIYLDANASHPLLKRVKSRLSASLEGESANAWGNASSLHAAGRRSRKLLFELRAEIQVATGLDTNGWTFTSGATEALNMILNTALVEGRQLWHSGVEHSAVLKFCEKRMPEAKSLPVLPSGELDLENLGAELARLGPGVPVLVVLQSHNNETGLPLVRTERLPDFRRLVDAHPDLHVVWDAVQSLAKVDPRELKTLLSTASYAVISAHKIGAIPGMGAVWREKSASLKSLLLGGSQEQGLRAGTEALWSALSWHEALVTWREDGERLRSEWAMHKSALEAEFKALPQLRAVAGTWAAAALPNTLALIVDGVRSDLMLQRLDLEGICVSSGSACRSGVAEPSHVLRAMGLSDDDARSFLRISMPAEFSEADRRVLVSALQRILA